MTVRMCKLKSSSGRFSSDVDWQNYFQLCFRDYVDWQPGN